MNCVRSFWRDERGNGTIEFVIMMPLFMLLLLSTIELGMAMTRQVMLDRSLDLTVRQIRLGGLPVVTHDTIKAEICANALVIPNCTADLKLEMRPLDPRGLALIPDDVDCIDRADDSVPVREFVPGTSNELMILRACALFDPYFPTTGLGAQIPKESGNAYALVAVASFVIEPTG